MKIPNNPSAILFDFDGVLLDSLPLHRAGWYHAVDQVYGDDKQKLRQLDWEQLKGLNSAKISQKIAEFMAAPESASRLISTKFDYISQHYAPLFSGTKEAVEFFQSKFKNTAIVSNAGRQFIERHLKHHQLNFNEYFGIEDHKEPKPSALAYIDSATKLGLQHSEHKNIIVYEDTAHGVSAAAKAKMFVIGVIGDKPESKSTLMSAGASLIVKNVCESIQFFKT